MSFYYTLCKMATRTKRTATSDLYELRFDSFRTSWPPLNTGPRNSVVNTVQVHTGTNGKRGKGRKDRIGPNRVDVLWKGLSVFS